MPLTIAATRKLYEGWLDLLMLTLRDPRGTTFERVVVDHPHGAVVLPYDPERRVALLVSEERPPLLHAGATPLIEAIGGKIDDGTPESTARREAMEEAGVSLGVLEPVATVWPTPASSTERIHLFLAPYGAGDRIAPGGGLAEENERLSVRELPLGHLWAMAEARTLHDGKTLTLLQALRIRRPDLFGA